MTWLFWSIPILARLMIGIFFVIEAILSIKSMNRKYLVWSYLELVSGVFLVVGFLATPAILILLYINNRYYLNQSNQLSFKLTRLLMVNGVLLLLFDPHWINSFIIYLERTYIYHH